MVSVDSLGTTERMADRILFMPLRAEGGSAAKYSATVFGFPGSLLATVRLVGFARFIPAMLQGLPLRVHALV